MLLMVGKAHSEDLKRRIRHEKREDAYQKAMEAVKADKEKAEKERRGLEAIAGDFNISPKALRNRLKGGKSYLERNGKQQLLTPAEENKIVELAVISSDWGDPLTTMDITKYANALLAKRPGETSVKVGKNWASRFLVRHHKRLQMYWSKPLDTQRAKGLTREAVDDWFKILKEQIVENGILPENIYGMDESGFPPSNQGSQRVIGRAGNKIQHKQGGANRENVTAVVTICADGSTLRPLVIFKGEYLMKRWIKDNVCDAS